MYTVQQKKTVLIGRSIINFRWLSPKMSSDNSSGRGVFTSEGGNSPMRGVFTPGRGQNYGRGYGSPGQQTNSRGFTSPGRQTQGNIRSRWTTGRIVFHLSVIFHSLNRQYPNFLR